jgi:hypothetical protein
MSESGDEFAAKLTGSRLRNIYEAWKSLGAGRVGPARDAITPAQLRGAMPWTFRVDRAGEDFRFSFAGEQVIQFMGTRLSGRTLSEMTGTPFFDGMQRFFSRCVEVKAPLQAGPLRAIYPGKEHLEMEVIVLPLSDDGVGVTALLGAFETWRAGTHTG